MAITAAMRQDIIELAVLTNNAAPGTTLLAELVALANAGSSLTAIADHLIARPGFTATYPTHQTANEFGTEWIGNILPEASSALQTECVAIVEAHINGGGSIAAMIVAVQEFMSAASESDANLGTHIANFNHKVEVATYHTITSEAAAEWTIPSSVNSTESTVATGKSAVDTALTPAVATYSLAADSATVSEGGDTVFTLTTTNVAAGTKYSYTITGVSSADLSSGSLSGLAEVDSNGKATVSVGLANDATTEGAETMTLSVAGQTAAVSITDSSTTPATPASTTYTLSVTGSSVDEGNSGQTNLTYSLSLDKAAEADVVVNYETVSGGTATAGTDYDSTSGAVTFSAGQQNATVTVKVNGDTTFESDETVSTTFTGSSLTASVTGVSGTISNDDTDPDTVAQAKTLTTGTDSFTTGSANDTFDGSTAGSLDTVDVIDGAGGTDTLTATLGAGSVRPTISNVETIKLTATGGLTIDTRDISGATSYNNESSSGDLTLNFLASLPTVTLNTIVDDVTLNFTDAALAGASDNLTINVNNMTLAGGELITITDAGGTTNKLETVTLNSTSLASTIGDLVTAGVGTATVNITGDANLTLTNALDTAVTSVTAGDFTGDLGVTGGSAGVAITVTSGSGADTITTNTGNDTVTSGAGNDIINTNTGNDIVTSGAGNDTITVSTGTVSVTAGAGNDSIVMGATLTSADTVAGGDGTDTITHQATVDADFTNVTSVEAVTGAAAGTYVLGTKAQAAGVTTITTTDAIYTVSAGAYTTGLTVNAAASANKADSFTTGTGNDTFKFALANGLEDGDIIVAGTGTDTIILDNSGGAVTAVLDLDDVSGVENVTVGDANGAVTTAEAVSLTFSAVAETTTQAITVDGSVITDADDDLTVDGSNNATATTTFVITGGAGDDILTGGDGIDTITGGSGADTIDGDAGNDIITGGAGNDILTGNAGNDTISGGAGNDAITLAAGNDIVTGGSGNDTFAVTTNLTSEDTVDAGAGTDTMTISAATVDADFTNVTNLEALTGGGAGTYTLGTKAQAASITTVTLTDAAYTIAASAYTTGLTVDASASTGNTDTITTGSGDDVIKFASTTGLADADIIAMGTGTDVIQLNNSGGAVTAVADMDDISGVLQFTVTDANGAATTAEAVSLTFAAIAETTTQAITVDGSVITDADDDLTVDGSNNATATTTFVITGGAGDDILTGGDGVDTITGGSGADTIDGDAGNDIVTGGAGNDILTGNAGNDTISGGAGNDAITMAAGNDIVTGGSGNDTFAVTTNLTSSDSLDAGTGTDTITISAATVDADFTNVSNLEKLTGGGAGTYTLGTKAQAAGITTITLTDAAYTIAASAFTTGLTIDATASANDTLSLTTGSGDDTFKFDGTTGLETGDTIVAGTGTNIVQLDNSAAAVTAVTDLDTVSGVTQFTVTDADGASTTAQAVSLTFSAVSEGTVQTINVDGSVITDADDDLTVNAGSVAVPTTAFVITGGAGDDILTGGDGADTITGGDGADTLDGDAGNDIITAGAGNDIISTTTAHLTGLDTIAGGAGTDVLSVTDASTVVDDDFSNMTSVETLTLANAAHTVTLGSKATLTGIVTVNGNADADNITLGALYTNDVTITSNNGADIITTTNYTKTLTYNGGTAVDTLNLGSHAVTWTGGNGADIVNVMASGNLNSADTLTGGTGADVINLSVAMTVSDADFTNVLTFTTLTTGAVNTTVNLGAQAKEAGITIITSGNGILTLNASAYTSTALTVTGGTKADIIQGGTGADILSGGGGSDTYKFNATGALNGNDAITFVVADDKFDFSNMGTFTWGGEVATGGTGDVLLSNKIYLFVDGNGGAASDQAAEIDDFIEGNGDAFHLGSGEKGILISGYDGDTGDSAFIWLIDDSVGANAGTIEVDDVALIGTLATFDLDTLFPSNFS